MHAVADLLTKLTGQPTPVTRAPYPVWAGSHAGPVKPPATRLTRKDAIRLYHSARRYEARTRQPGRQDGALGRNGLAVLQSLIHDFRNHLTGRCDPSIASLARRASISVRSAHRGLAALRDAGMVQWLRRCTRTVENGVVRLRQRSSMYAIHPPSEWRDVPPSPPPPSPPPHPTSWGATLALPSPAPHRVAKTDLPGPLAAALTALQRRIAEAETPVITGLPT